MQTCGSSKGTSRTLQSTRKGISSLQQLLQRPACCRQHRLLVVARASAADHQGDDARRSLRKLSSIDIEKEDSRRYRRTVSTGSCYRLQNLSSMLSAASVQSCSSCSRMFAPINLLHHQLRYTTMQQLTARSLSIPTQSPSACMLLWQTYNFDDWKNHRSTTRYWRHIRSGT